MSVDTYDFTEKTKYRQRVWCAIEKICCRPKALRTVAYLDTSEALESKFLLDRGYCAERLFAINRSAAEAAWITMRLKKDGYSAVNTIGTEWEQAINNRLSSDQIDVCNFDGMGCLTQSLIDTLRLSVIKTRPRVLAVNMLGGREQKDEYGYMMGVLGHGIDKEVTTSVGRKVRGSHMLRIKLLLQAITEPIDDRCWIHIDSVSWDVYISSSGQPMVWCVAGLSPHIDIDVEDLCRTNKTQRSRFRSAANVGVFPHCCFKEPLNLSSLAVFERSARSLHKAEWSSAVSVAIERGATSEQAVEFAKHYVDNCGEFARIFHLKSEEQSKEPIT